MLELYHNLLAYEELLFPPYIYEHKLTLPQ
jgi:hypothetical protein